MIQVGPAAAVRADGSQEMLDRMKIVVEDGELKILPRREQWDDRDWRELEPATYYVTLPKLSAVAAVGSGDMTIDRVDADSFSASLAGSGRLAIAHLAAADARLSLAGSGTVSVRGSVEHLQVSVSGSGGVRAPDLASTSAAVSIAGSGNAELTVKDTANVSTLGSGEVAIAGGATCAVSGFGSGRTRCNGVIVESDHASRWGMMVPPHAPPAPPAPRWEWNWPGGWNGQWNDRRDD